MILTIKKLLGAVFLLLITLLVVWAVGFALFLYELEHQPVPSDALHSDAVVVLTGGAERVKEGIRLLQNDIADTLFISGVGQGVTVDDLLRASQYTQYLINDNFKQRITLGREAANTKGNAEETSEWATAHRVRSIRLVTAYYHMPRSRLEFHFMMPNLHVTTHPVRPNNFNLWNESGIQLALLEYHKFIAVLLRQAGIWQI